MSSTSEGPDGGGGPRIHGESEVLSTRPTWRMVVAGPHPPYDAHPPVTRGLFPILATQEPPPATPEADQVRTLLGRAVQRRRRIILLTAAGGLLALLLLLAQGGGGLLALRVRAGPVRWVVRMLAVALAGAAAGWAVRSVRREAGS